MYHITKMKKTVLFLLIFMNGCAGSKAVLISSSELSRILSIGFLYRTADWDDSWDGLSEEGYFEANRFPLGTASLIVAVERFELHPVSPTEVKFIFEGILLDKDTKERLPGAALVVADIQNRETAVSRILVVSKKQIFFTYTGRLIVETIINRENGLFFWVPGALYDCNYYDTRQLLMSGQ